ncbi:cytochrome P450 [Spongiactinospora rosea]|uniref:Cytochrome P450 n=1 Tax=Spongiactinospora rosea TaxID=2248750 RepID=A0A366LXV0_9ACTN|nr:cytochrome P450 [Spongiactinospora rosea]RBQ18798.1 cytochrome P450 [Spongiactinospora rosea]
MTDSTVFDQDYLRDPHEVFARLREQGPVTPTATAHGVKIWLVTRYDDVKAAMTDPRISKAFAGNLEVFKANELEGGDSRGAAAVVPDNMLFSDPPDHTRLRRIAVKAFTAGRIRALRPRIEQISARLLDPLGTEFDLLEDYAIPLPAMVIGELLGVPEADWPRLIRLSGTAIEGSAHDPAEVVAAAQETLAYLTDLCAAKRADPADDLISAMVAVHDEDGGIDDVELISTSWVLMVAGHETTVHLIGNGMRALLAHPAQMARLRADPALLPDAIEEFLRYDGPVATGTYRYTTEPVTIGGVDIPAGQLIVVCLLSANRDAARYEDAGRFDITRKPAQHLTFGHGVHYCLGAPLARVEGEVAFRHLLERFPGLRPAVPIDRLTWRPGMLMHGLTALPVRTRP